MESNTVQLSPSDRKLLEGLRQSRFSFWRKPVAWLLIVLGSAVLALHLVAMVLDAVIDGGPLLFIGAIMLLAGCVELQEIRYRRILHHLLVELDSDGPGEG